jgi:hypothetical protein
MDNEPVGWYTPTSYTRHRSPAINGQEHGPSLSSAPSLFQHYDDGFYFYRPRTNSPRRPIVSDSRIPDVDEPLLQSLIRHRPTIMCLYPDPLNSHRICQSRFPQYTDLPRHICVTHRNTELEAYWKGEKALDELPALIISVICAFRMQALGAYGEQREWCEVAAKRIEEWASSGDLQVDLSGLDGFERAARLMGECWIEARCCPRCGKVCSTEDSLTMHLRDRGRGCHV